MGTKGVKQTDRETAETLAAFGNELVAEGKKLIDLANAMLIKRPTVSFLIVRYSPGAHRQLTKTIKPYVLDAYKKAEKRGIVIKNLPTRQPPNVGPFRSTP